MADARRRAATVGAGVILALAAGLFVFAAARLPWLETRVFGYDWHNYWQMFQGGRPSYAGVDVFNPPWTIIMLWPLGALPFRESWAVFTLLTLAVLVGSLPRRPTGHLDLAAALMLFSSYWVLRAIVDGNLPAVVIAGAGLAGYGWRTRSPAGLAAGLLLLTAKYQESWLAVLIIGAFTLRVWPARRWGWAALGILAIAGPSLLWLGAEWRGALFPPLAGSGQFAPAVDRLNSNITLLAALRRASVPGWWQGVLWLSGLAATLAVAVRCRWDLSPRLIGFLIGASLLLSPYATGSSITTLWVAGVLPLAQRHWGLAWAGTLIGLGPFLTGALGYGAGWPDDALTLLLLAVWGLQAWDCLRPPLSAAPVPQPAAS